MSTRSERRVINRSLCLLGEFTAHYINRHERQQEQAQDIYRQHQMKRRFGAGVPGRHAELSELQNYRRLTAK
jgi:hypothetical protein